MATTSNIYIYVYMCAQKPNLREFLCVIWAVEILARDGGLATRHVPPDDEVSAPIVLPHHHMVHCFTRTSHVHGVRQIVPQYPVVVGLLSKHFIGFESNNSFIA
jgi:hypothetical protein